MRKTWAKNAKTAVLALVCAAAAQQAAAVNKCTAADGKVVYQDAPCGNAVKSSVQVRTWTAPTDSAAGGRLANLPPPKTIEWRGHPDEDLVRAEALLDAMSAQGRDCEWALKVTRGASIAQKCVPFITIFQPVGSFAQVNQKLLDLMTDKEWSAAAIVGIRRVSRLMQDVVRQKEIMTAHLNTP